MSVIRGDKRRKYISRLELLTDEGLFHAMIDARIPDDYEGAYTSEGAWEANTSYQTYATRMGYTPDKDDLV